VKLPPPRCGRRCIDRTEQHHRSLSRVSSTGSMAQL